MKHFCDKVTEGLVGKKEIMGGNQWIYRFDNDYGASVIDHMGSYGTELAVVKFDELGQFKLTYDTPVTDDVIGHLTEDLLVETLGEIKAL